jgi:hypothetical protein
MIQRKELPRGAVRKLTPNRQSSFDDTMDGP